MNRIHPADNQMTVHANPLYANPVHACTSSTSQSDTRVLPMKTRVPRLKWRNNSVKPAPMPFTLQTSQLCEEREPSPAASSSWMTSLKTSVSKAKRSVTRCFAALVHSIAPRSRIGGVIYAAFFTALVVAGICLMALA